MRINAWLITGLAAISMIVGAVAQQPVDEAYMRLELQRRNLQLQIDQARLENELRRHQLEQSFDQLQQQRLWQLEKRRLDDAQSEAQEARKKSEKAEAAARQIAEDIQATATQDGVATRNYAYVLASVVLGFGLIAFARTRILRGDSMKIQTTDGILLILASAFLMVTVVVISENYHPDRDLIQNVLLSLRVQVGESAGGEHLIDVPAKFVLLGLLVILFYGVTTLLCITRLRPPES